MDPLVLGLIIFLGIAVIIIILYFMLKHNPQEEDTLNVRKDLDDLKKNISALEKQGMKKEDIIKKMTDSGWKEHVVELVLHDLHKPSHDIDKVQDYVKRQKLKAISTERIKEALIDAGWSQDLIDVVLEIEKEEVKTGKKLVEKKTPKQIEREKKKLAKINEEAKQKKLNQFS